MSNEKKRGITILEVHDCQENDGYTLNKTFTMIDGEINKSNFSNVSSFNVEERKYNGINGLYNVFKEVSENPLLGFIRGKLKKGMHNRGVLRRSNPSLDRNTGQTITPAFEEVPIDWVMLDCDGLKLPKGLNAIDNPDECATFYVRNLSKPFQDVTFFYSFSNSQNVKNTNKLHIHIFMLLSKPITSLQAKKLLKADFKAKLVDPALFQAVQLHYTASPTFIGMDDPLPIRHGLIKGNIDKVDISKINLTVVAKKDKSSEIPFELANVSDHITNTANLKSLDRIANKLEKRLNEESRHHLAGILMSKCILINMPKADAIEYVSSWMIDMGVPRDTQDEATHWYKSKLEYMKLNGVNLDYNLRPDLFALLMNRGNV
jgi:hypothetical protein